ncbi:hypothetical protein MJG53_003432 [Ovis ammon polii x Ovis aries]|uniref:Uncharacterized protein n=1 Tax=Ovis ammon polii x Ovis aries TaxID=2918886 RepID=A0ACB9VG95_9CETA|nr:hypothetical protein MJG53_003432 [Ovis ammon polii x Ovis aries]
MRSGSLNRIGSAPARRYRHIPAPHSTPFPPCYQRGGTGPVDPQDFGSISKRAFCESACSPPGLLLPHPPPVSDARTARALQPQPVHTVSQDTPVSRMAPLSPSPRLPLWIPAPAPGPAVQLLLLLLLLVPAHPQSLLWMQGAPATGGDSSGEDDPLGEEDLPSEEDIPEEEDSPGEEDLPGLKMDPGEENSLKLEDLPTIEAPRDTEDLQNNAHRDEKGAPLPLAPYPLSELDEETIKRDTERGAPPWPQVSPACAGRFQSPVDIRPELTAFCPALQPLELLGFELPPQPKLRLCNNGHTVQLSLPSGLKMALGPGQEYRALQLHLHWGAAGRPGSEHTVDGHRFPAEIHVVHLSTAFEEFDEALGRPGGLAVLAAFLQGVIWTVFNQTVKLSAKQVTLGMRRQKEMKGPCGGSGGHGQWSPELHTLADSLWGPDDSRLQLNFRATQPLNGRIIEASFPAGVDGSPRTVEPGDILALVFGLLFAVTSIAFLVQMRRQQRYYTDPLPQAQPPHPRVQSSSMQIACK